jgi:PiT family inorganic phosphate transporter
MDNSALFILLVISVALIFDFINGFHDAANSIATIVTTKALTPKQAVLWAAFFNFIAFLVFNLTVAQTIGVDLVDSHLIDAHFILSALLGAIFWNLTTWYFGLPSSSSHALIGGLAGSALAKGGFSALKVTGFIKVLIGIFVSPLLGLLVSLVITYALTQLVKKENSAKLKKLFYSIQLCTSALLSLSHGSNDAQKTMGIIAILLFSSSWLKGPFYVPFWVVISCQAAISIGTLAGGWRIVHTMGTQITKLDPMKGCSAEAGAAIALFTATHYGIPVSTTYIVTGSILGVGLTQGSTGARWHVMRRIFLAWLLTVPAAGIIAAVLTYSF